MPGPIPQTRAVRQDPSRGLIASYAWGRDYHDLVLPRLDALGAELVDRIPGASKARSACGNPQ